MLLDWIHDLVPYEVSPSSLFCDIEVGDVFQEPDGLWRLLYRDATKVSVVKLSWWTRLWWGGTINGKELVLKK